MMYLRFAAYCIIAFILTLAEIVLFPFCPKDGDRLKWDWANSIWGNDVDTIHGDTNWKNKQAKWPIIRLCPSYCWSIRNPVHNLLLNHFSASGILTEWSKKGKYTTVATIGGKRYFFIHRPVKWKNDPMKFGWKLWDDKMVVGQRAQCELVFNP